LLTPGGKLYIYFFIVLFSIKVQSAHFLFCFFGFSSRTMEADQLRGQEALRPGVSPGLPVQLSQHEQARGSAGHQRRRPGPGRTVF